MTGSSLLSCTACPLDATTARSTDARRLPSLSCPTLPPTLSLQDLMCDTFRCEPLAIQVGAQASSSAIEPSELLNMLRTLTETTASVDEACDDWFFTHGTTAKQWNCGRRKTEVWYKNSFIVEMAHRLIKPRWEIQSFYHVDWCSTACKACCGLEVFDCCMLNIVCLMSLNSKLFLGAEHLSHAQNKGEHMRKSIKLWYTFIQWTPDFNH